jgi:hypothetical protein
MDNFTIVGSWFLAILGALVSVLAIFGILFLAEEIKGKKARLIIKIIHMKGKKNEEKHKKISC